MERIFWGGHGCFLFLNENGTGDKIKKLLLLAVVIGGASEANPENCVQVNYLGRDPERHAEGAGR